MIQICPSAPGSDLVIRSVETCQEVPASPDEEDELFGRRGVEVVLENFDTTQLRISPKVPPASVHRRLTLAKKAASGSVYRILNKKKSSKTGRPRLSCKIEGCKEQVSGRRALYRHYSYVHFKEDLLGLMGWDGKAENCPYCDLKFTKSNDAVGHVGCVHNKIEDFLPKRLHIKSNGEEKISKPKPSSGQLHRANNPFKTSAASGLSCGLCEDKKEFGSRNHLYEHYSHVHYRAQLLPFINEDSAECSRCKITLKSPSVTNKVRHMGVTHGLLEKKNILPSHLRVPKIYNTDREGKKSVEKSVPGFSCGLCEEKKEFGSRNRLYEHYAQIHYRDQLRPYINEDSAECSRCKTTLKVSAPSAKIRHMGVVHGLLERENILPSHLWVPKISNAVREKKKSNKKGRKCQLCQSRFINRNRLYTHYSISHFKDDLSQHIDRNTMECPYCGEKKNKMGKGWEQSRITITITIDKENTQFY